MKVLITGVAGFIGFHLCKALLKEGCEVVGLDNVNDYYDVDLKYSRLKELGIDRIDASCCLKLTTSNVYDKYFCFIKMNLEDKVELTSLFENHNFDVVVNLAAQAGVRYSLDNPDVYIQSNIVGFFNVLECCRKYKINHLLYASSSGVYGANKKMPFKTTDNVDNPISLYAATKKSNELMAHTYSHLYRIRTTGLRFFTVYGPWGRPDMAPFLFADAISKKRKISVFNNGNMFRDFTYIDDVIEGVVKIILTKKEKRELYKIYNIGNNKPVRLLSFIDEIEQNIGEKAIKKMLPIQPGDVEKTWANVDGLKNDYNYFPETSLHDGVKSYIKWFKIIDVI